MYSSNPMDEYKKSIIWDKWGSGHSMAEIAKAIHKSPATIFSYLRYHGGIQPYKRTRRILGFILG